MDNIQIITGEKRVTINGDHDRVIVFNPTDALFAERFYALLSEMQKTLKDFKAKGEALTTSERDEDGMPVNMQEHISLQKYLCDYLREKIDKVFGDGTSQKAFGEVRNLDVYLQFFDGILPFFQQARSERVAMYTTSTSAKRNRRKK